MATVRDKRVNLKVTAKERAAWQALADAAGLTLADLIRERLGEAAQVRRVPMRRAARRADPLLLASLGRLGNNLNQIARWANTYKDGADAVQVLGALAAIERELLFLLPRGTREAGGEAQGLEGDEP